MNSAICTPVRSFPLKPLAAAVLLIYAAGIQSAPVFQSSPGGNVTVTNPDVQTTVVTQEGNRAVANWREFSIDAGETVQFVQDNANSVILNRVTGEDISQILGNLQANGRVFLINPNGIVFGSNAQVSVNGLVASTLSLKPGMQSGSDEVGLELNGPGASIVNHGRISAKDILLIAPSIENNGTLQGDGNNSKVQLIAAGQVNVNTAEGNLVFQVAAGHENAVIQQLGTVMAEGGQIVLLASSSVGEQPSVINVANLNLATQIIVQGDSVRLSGDIQSAQGNALLEVTARNINQENAVRVAGDVVLNSDAVELLDAQNDFAGTMAVNVTGQLAVSDSNQLQIQGAAGNAILNAGENVVVDGLNVNDHLAISAATEANLGQLSANSLSVNAQRVNQAQNTAVEIDTDSRLTADRLNLTNSGNRFEGVVDLVVQGQAALHGSHSLTVAGEAGYAVLSGADVVLGDLSAGRLDVDAVQLSQLGDTAVRVSGVSALLANSATLDQDGNEFAGQITLDVTSQAELSSRGRLEVAGQVNNAALQAENLVLSGLNVAGDLSLDAGTIGQTTGIDVQGITRIRNASTVNLDLSNDFVGQVSLDGVDTAEVNLADRNQIQVSGQVGDITIVSTDATAGVVSLGRLQAGSLTANANAVRHIDGADPDSAIAVSGSTQLTANHIELANNANDFTGAVHLDVRQAAQIHDANLLNVSGETGETRLQASSIELAGAFNVTGNLTLRADSIQGNSPLTVAGMSTIEQAQFVNLNNTTNDFVGSVNLLEAGEVGLFDRNSVEVQGQVNSLEASTPLAGSGQVTLGELAAENLVLHSQRIAQNGSVTVHGESRFNAGEIELSRADNDFVGVVQLSVSGQASLQDANELRVGGVVNALVVEAQTAIIDGLTAQGDLTISADAIRQEGALIADGNTFLAGGAANLASSSSNIFAGTVDLDLTGAAAVHASGDLELAGKASFIDATATGVLSVSQLDAPDILLNAAQLELNSLQAIGDLTLNGGRVRQQGALTVEGVTALGASDVELLESSNDFKGSVILNNAGQVALQDMNDIRIQGQTETLNIQAGGVIEQTGAVSVNGASRVNGRTVNLNNESNQFGGEVSLQALQNATIQSNGNLRLSALADELNVGASGNLELGTTRVETLNAISSGQIVQNSASALTVGRLAALSAQSIRLNNSDNDFQGVVDLTTEGAAEIRDRNDLQIQGEVQNLIANAGNGTLIAGGSESLEFVNGTLTASSIELSRVLVSESAVFQANSIGQSQAVDTGGTLTLTANTVSLGLENNDFRGDVVLNGVRNANVADTNQLSLRGTAEQLNVDANERLTLGRLQANSLSARAQRIDQTSSSDSVVQVSGETNLIAADVELLNNNDFQGALNLEVEGAAQLRDQNTLSVQGSAGQLEASARTLEQSGALSVAGSTLMNVNTATLDHSANDFQGEVVFNASGNVHVVDANALSVSGQVNGSAQFTAQRVDQSNVLQAGSSMLVQSENVNLSNSDNQFNGAVRIENAVEANLNSSGTLSVTGANLGNVSLTADEVTLGALGQLRTLNVVADKVDQNSALLVQGQTTLTVRKAELSHSSNDFVGDVLVQARAASNPDVEITDINSLIVRGDDLQLGAQVQGDLTVRADDLVLGQSAVLGDSQIFLTGDLTQNGAASLGDALLSADRIVLTNSSNQFAGTVQIDSSDEVVLRTAGDFNANMGSSTATLTLNVNGNANLQGEHVRFAQSQFDKTLGVNANQISQELAGGSALEVRGNTELAALGGTINLSNSSNRFTGLVSATAEQTNIASRNDLQLLNLNSRGGNIVTDGRLLLLGNIEQSGGTLTFAAHGVPRPLSSAEITLLLPPTLDVFSAKEAVNPITGLGRISLASTAIEQTGGQITTAAGSLTRFMAIQNGSVVLTKDNRINGQISALSGDRFSSLFDYLPNRGASLFAVNNNVKLTVGAQGVEADVIAIRSRGLATQGQESLIRARMPYNDVAVGTARSYAGLTLSIPLNGAVGGSSPVASFGESSANGLPGSAGAIRVEVGDISRPGLGGFLTVLPFEGSNLLPGQVVYLAGPERNGMQAFFYDGARSLNRVPVVYNGSLLLSPQENAALTTAQGAVVLARQEQTRSVVRTENVAGKIINGVVVEVGPGSPATEGEGGAGKPSSCDAADTGLACNP